MKNTIQVMHSINPKLDLLGVICTQYDGRIASYKSWRKTIKETFGDKFIGDIHVAAIMKDCSDRKKPLQKWTKATERIKNI
ncbi:MAG: hypothetical protein LBJ36_06365 [Synergistaceae bacterium]|nr:hypothetical protein [Synergistaceae bacterium]